MNCLRMKARLAAESAKSLRFRLISKSAKVPKAPTGFVGRGVPDVAGNADPETGYNVVVDGQQAVIGGTSAVAPLWAGLLALINQSLGTNVGYINPLLYSAKGRTHIPRHYFRNEWRLFGGSRLGCMHRARKPKWRQTPDCFERQLANRSIHVGAGLHVDPELRRARSDRSILDLLCRYLLGAEATPPQTTPEVISFHHPGAHSFQNS